MELQDLTIKGIQLLKSQQYEKAIEIFTIILCDIGLDPIIFTYRRYYNLFMITIFISLLNNYFHCTMYLNEIILLFSNCYNSIGKFYYAVIDAKIAITIDKNYAKVELLYILTINLNFNQKFILIFMK